MTLSALALFDSRRKLGVRKEKSPRAVLRLAWRGGSPPLAPPVADYSARWSYIMGGNNRFGTCGPTCVANMVGLSTKFLTGAQVVVSDEEVFDLYRRSGNPSFDPRTGRGDEGVINSEMLQALIYGGIGGRSPLAYAQLADSSDASLYAAIDIFGGVMMGCTLQTAQSRQTDAGLWSYNPSGEWGGHDVCLDRYVQSTGRVGLVTWQEEIDCDRSFRANQVDEYWVVLWPEIFSNHPAFDQQVDMAALAADYTALTGRPWPEPVPPQPPPQPPPPDGTGVVTVEVSAKHVTMPAGWTASNARPGLSRA